MVDAAAEQPRGCSAAAYGTDRLHTHPHRRRRPAARGRYQLLLQLLLRDVNSITSGLPPSCDQLHGSAGSVSSSI